MFCQKCVERFDHHCHVIDNCVGAKNHAYFLFYLILAWLYVASALYVMVTNSHFGATGSEMEAHKNRSLEKNFLAPRAPYLVAFFFSTAVATPALAILTYLVYTHALNVLQGTTTRARRRALMPGFRTVIRSSSGTDSAKGYTYSDAGSLAYSSRDSGYAGTGGPILRLQKVPDSSHDTEDSKGSAASLSKLFSFGKAMGEEEKRDSRTQVDIQYVSGSPLEAESAFQSLAPP